ncbi:hypothetical protein LTR56_017648 [Elasticomyces elasticus]|nr:hypothetical protein LTR56_017648 [Elasticomyces elasticus]KAK3638576.1 hypothetical protein LTR22_017760 [Elasticomyces elasticus]KAK4913044.1 hypothetical protein LTR49_018602 [Elasticomyces elasticus]
MAAMKTDPSPPPPSYQTEAMRVSTNALKAEANFKTKEKDAKATNDESNNKTAETQPGLVHRRLYVLPRDSPTWRQKSRTVYNVPDDDSYFPFPDFERYECVFPSLCYKDIRLARTTPRSSRYWISLLGKEFQAEPIVVFRKSAASVSSNLAEPIQDAEASFLAESYLERVCKLVEKDIGVKAKFVELAQNKICSRVAEVERLGLNVGYCDWHRETNACITESEGSAGVVGAEHLLRRLQEYLVFIGKKQEDVPCVARLQADVQLVRRRATYMAQQQKAILNPVSKQKAVVKAATCCCTCHKATNA